MGGNSRRTRNGTGARLWYNGRVSGSSRNAALRAFAPAWLAGEEKALRLLPDGFRRADARAEAVRRAASRQAGPALLEELARQNRELAPSPARDRSLAALASGGAATVVTGQQVGLFTGPAFTFYKAAGAVAAARELSRESGVPCVPLFWLQTEDHDWDEIDHCFVRGDGDAPQRVRSGGGESSSRASVSSRVFGSDVESAVRALDGAVAGRPDRERVVDLVRRHYCAGATPARAFRGMLAELFDDDGLLFLDPRTSGFAAIASPLLERSFAEAASVSATLEARAQEIETAGFAVQVPVRAGSPLAFFHPDGATGPRFRVEPCTAGWRLCSAESAREIGGGDLDRAIAADPLCASTSALLRPLVQDALLPNAAYVAGPGEIAYFAELAPVYALLGIQPSLVLPRPSFCVTAAGDRRRLEQLGTSFDRMAGDREAVLGALATSEAAGFDPDSVARDLARAFAARLDEIAPHVLAVDASLARPIDKARASVEHTIARFVDKYRHSFLLRDGVRVERLDRLRAALAPDGVPQERVYGFVSLAAEHGLDALVAAVREAAWPMDGRTREIAL
jgi:bacillithiol biosynthesis cysteine-adding enzyme BshC